MAVDLQEHLTSAARAFLEPKNATHRQYEALRAYFVEGLPSAEVAERFGYTPGSFRVLCHKFRQDPERAFFLSPRKGPRPSSPRESHPERERIIALRKQNLSIYDITEALQTEGWRRSPASVAAILQEEGFARLPRRRDDERPARVRPEVAQVADVRQLDLSPRRFRTKFGGLFLFVPYLAQVPFEGLLERAGFPGSAMIPAAHAMRSLLALKLFGNARASHVMSYVFDQGLASFAGLNVMPKRALLTEYSCRIDPRAYPQLMGAWFDAMNRLGLEWGSSASFDVDFHTIPFHGQDALVEKHYVSKRSRSQKGILAFLAQDAETRVFCYAHGELRRTDRNDEVLRFVQYWKEQTGHWPTELVFDSKLTTHRNLNQLTERGIDFITLRRRSKKMLAEIAQRPVSAWRRIRLDRVPGAYRTPRILDQRVQLRDYEGPCRQLVVADLGHENPTFLLTNQMRRSPAKLVGRYAQRMVIENGIADGIDFFHMDALSSAVPMKVNCDLQLTLMASSLYRLLGTQIGNGYATAKSRHIFRDFIDAVGHVTLTKDEVIVRFQKRAHNPLLLAAGFADRHPKVPWLGNRRLRLLFG
jgi:transposase